MSTQPETRNLPGRTRTPEDSTTPPATAPPRRHSEPHRWVDFTDYRRHAVDPGLTFELGDELKTFCGAVAVVCVRKVHHQAMWKTCQDCSDVALRLLAERSASAGAR